MIIKFTDIQGIRPIADNINDSKRVSPYIIEVENLYLRPFLGASLYKLIETTPTDYAILLSGDYYTFLNEENETETAYFNGLTAATAYLTYSRFLKNQNMNVTAFGIVQKQTQFSENSDYRSISAASNDAEKIGLQYLDECILYLKRTSVIEKEKKTRKINKFKSIGD